MQYIALSESNGTFYLETSPDGITFTAFSSVVNTINTTSLFIEFGIGTSNTEVADAIAIFGAFTLSPRSGVPQFSDNFLKSAAGIPTNTASVVLASASSQYAHAADSSSLDITGDITLETYFKANSLPAVGSSMTLIGKWDESSTKRSYKLDLYGISGYFGTGADSSLTISTNTTDAPIDSGCSGASDTQQLFCSNASFAAGQLVYITQMQGGNAGQWETGLIQSYTGGLITLAVPLIGTYNNAGGAVAQVIVVKQYTNITINNGVTWKPKAWNGQTGGVLRYLGNGVLTNNGTISGDGLGFRGGATTPFYQGSNGEGSAGASIQPPANQDYKVYALSGSNGSGGGGGSTDVNQLYSAAGGGGNGSTGGNGSSVNGARTAVGGNPSGTTDLFNALPGGGGGGGSLVSEGSGTNNGGNGGAFLFLVAPTITGTGTITSNGANATSTLSSKNSGSGGGAGGSILLIGQSVDISGMTVTASPGTGTAGYAIGAGAVGGNGATGRIAIHYLNTANVGGATPTPVTIQDNTLVTTAFTQARLLLSSNGTNSEILTQNIPNLTTGAWERLSIAWQAAQGQATFYINGQPIGTTTGSFTAIANESGALTIGANNSGSGIANYFDGELNDTRIWNVALDADTILANTNIQISAASPGLVAYYKFNSALTDATGNSNNLTGVNTPTYTPDVPFANPTTRLDIDTQNTNIGETYSLPTSITEDATDSLPFTPLNDPQASVAFYVGSAGTGNWTVTVHDTQNRVIAEQTILAASIPASGIIEFFFDTPWRILLNYSYHMHLTVSTGSSTVVTGVASDFSTAEYATYFGFLVSEPNFHPIVQFQYQPLGGSLTGAMIIGNERYLAVWDGGNYLPNFIAFPPGWHVRCFGFWRQYLAIGMTRGDTIDNWNTGRIYFWSGYQPAFDFFIDVPTGQVNAMYGIDTDLYFMAGYQGWLMDYQGGFFYNNGNTQSEKLKRMPLLQNTDIVQMYPGAMTMWHGYLHMGLYGQSTSNTAVTGVYSWGSYNQFYPSILTMDYAISTGNYSSTVTIGLVYPIGDNLIIGWRDGTGTGADVVNAANPPAPSGEIQALLFDNGNIWKNERNYQIKADILALNTGESVAPEYNIDRAGWIVSVPASTIDIIDDDTFSKQYIGGSGWSREIQVGVQLFATGNTSPTLLGLSFLYDDTGEEDAF